MLILSLLLLSLLLVAGLAFLERRVSQQDGARRAVLTARARALAEAGIEDALQKLAKDPGFPPPWEERDTPGDPLNQHLFSYQENLLDIDNVTVLGRYEVKIDHRTMREPTNLMRISALGIVGDPDQPEASVRIQVVVDMGTADRATGTPPNPAVGTIVEWHDESAL
ncbi:MAG: hypothetical protein U0931_13245 [Vulcanimicrobiota bacterium]